MREPRPADEVTALLSADDFCHPATRARSEVEEAPRQEAYDFARDRRPDIHVVGISLSRVGPEALQRISELCDPQERQRAARFTFPRDRDLHLLARGLLRVALTRLIPHVDPATWRFASEPCGRPFIVSPPSVPFDFNISHCEGRVMCVISNGPSCGIDVEIGRRLPDVDLLARNVLAPSERDWLNAGPWQERPTRFLRLWTMKEAIAKAVGLGLRIPFDEIELDLSAAPTVRRAPPVCRGNWHLREGSSPSGHFYSVAVRCVDKQSFHFHEVEGDEVNVPELDSMHSLTGHGTTHAACCRDINILGSINVGFQESR
jgi:4'-phosphopantetheinyl transferase